MSGEALRQTKIRRALHRPQQVMGGERELMLTSMLVAGGLIVSAMNFVTTIIGVALWLVCVWGLRRMAKVDPVLSQVYKRQLVYRNYYAPFSRPSRKSKAAGKRVIY